MSSSGKKLDPTREIHAYLAGPDVFYPDAIVIGEQKKAILKQYGIIGHFPFDNTPPEDFLTNPKNAANTIGRSNELLMLKCCGSKDHIGVILANMVPYQGPSMDVGTAFEMGYISALAEFNPNIIIIGYTPDHRLFETRVIEDHFGGLQNITVKGHEHIGPDGNTIETFGGLDNLMMTQAIYKTGGAITKSFEEAAELAFKLAQAKIT